MPSGVPKRRRARPKGKVNAEIAAAIRREAVLAMALIAEGVLHRDKKPLRRAWRALDNINKFMDLLIT